MSSDKLLLSASLLTPFSFFTFENLQKIGYTNQCLRKGYDIVKCGDVWDLQVTQKNDC
jgi:hypothetical protein